MKNCLARLTPLVMLGAILFTPFATAGENEVLRGRFSKKLIEGMFRMPVENERSISQNIQKTVVKGTALTKGEITLELLPAENAAVLNITVEADTNSHSVGTNIPRKDITIHIHSTARTHIHAEKAVIIFPNRIEMRPATARARTELTYEGVDVNATAVFARIRDLKERIAHQQAVQKVRQEKPRQEENVSRQAEAEMRKLIDDRITPDMFRALNVSFNRDFYKPLFGSGRIPGTFHFSTLPLSLSVVIDAEQPLNEEVRRARPEMSTESVVAMRMHESLPTETANRRLRGKKFDEEDLEEYLIMQGIPAGLAHYRAGDAQLVTEYGQGTPIAVTFQGGEVGIALQTDRATLGEKEYRSLRAAARYRLSPGDETGMSLVRVGLDTIDDPEIQKRFARLLPPRMPMETLALPDTLDIKGTLQPLPWQIENGWLLMEWRLVK